MDFHTELRLTERDGEYIIIPRQGGGAGVRSGKTARDNVILEAAMEKEVIISIKGMQNMRTPNRTPSSW